MPGTQYTWRGTWNSGTAYVANDCINYLGAGYVCIQAGTNQNPVTQTAYWNLLTASGYSGATGAGTSGYSGYSGATGAQGPAGQGGDDPYELADYDLSHDPIYYVGETGTPGWRIVRMDIGTSGTTAASGASNYATNWGNRTGLTYG
jgi:hypothetical protein